MSYRSHLNPRTRRRGSTAIIAMLCLVVLATLAVSMFSTATTNVQSSNNLANVERARALAESGLRWQAYRFVRMTRPHTLAGKVDAAVAAALWPALKTAIRDDLNGMVLAAERGTTDHGSWIESRPIAVDGSADRFVITVEQPFVDPADSLGEAKVRVTSTATSQGATRSVSMLFAVTKKVRFAVVGKVPIQLGRNTVVEGPIGMSTANKYPPILMLSDFMHFHVGLRDRVTAWNTHLKSSTTVNGVQVKNHNGYDNRISVNHPLEMDFATRAGFGDVNGDAYIDEYDLFVKQFDANLDGGVSRAEFTRPFSSDLYDPNLFDAIDSLGAPMFAGDVQRVGYKDGVIDNRDGYTKVRGQIALAATATAWQANLTPQGKTINDMIQGAVSPEDPNEPPLKFGADQSDIFDLAPQNFEQASLNFAAKTGPAGGVVKRVSGRIENATLAAGDVAYSPPHVKVTAAGGTSLTVGSVVPTADFNAANAAAQAAGKANATSTTAPTTADEKTPYGSTSYQATYRRPVYRKVAFKNVKIPKGTNAVFEDCTFEGVTFVEMERNITTSSGAVTYDKNEGMTWSKKMNSGYSFSANTALTATTSQGFTKGNNLRFNNCVFEGPIAGNYATAYTHFTNSWEFTGATRFDNKVDQTATIVAPQVNIEMGSFTRPDQAPSTLVGVVVAGNIDIRGTSTVDGSIIITGDGAGNTTLAYFGASDSSTDAGANPEGGYGRLNIRYNPRRALPDGIDVAVDVLPDVASYKEGYDHAS